MRQHKHQTDDTTNDVEAEYASLARRKLLRLGGIAAAGAAGAAVIAAVDASPAAASDPNDVVFSADNSNATARTALIGDLSNAEVGGFFNDADAGAAVRGRGGDDAGLWATSWCLFAIGVFGESHEGIGVVGHSINDKGVFGISENEIGVAGSSSIAIGVNGYSDDGLGVNALSMNGTSLRASTTNPTNANPTIEAQTFGTGPAVRAIGRTIPASTGVGAGNAGALDVRGRAAFTRSGLTTIPAGATNAFTGLVPGGLLATSRVLATIQENKGTATVRAAVPITAAGANKGKIQIILTGAVPTNPAGGLKVAWFVFG